MIPLGKKGNEKYDASIRAKLKGSGSEKRKIAQKINSISRMNPENVNKKIYELISNPSISAEQIQRLIETALKKDLNDKDFISIINTCIKKHALLFGSKIEIDSSIAFKEQLELWREMRKEISE